MAYINGSEILFSPKVTVLSANTDVASAIKNSKRGTSISVNDVSPIEHNLEVKLSSEAITDFTGIEVARYGIDNNDTLYDCQTAIANADGTVEGLTSISPNMTVLVKTDTSNMGGETDTTEGENLITGVDYNIQKIIEPNNEGGYTINGEVSTETPIATFKLSTRSLEQGIYTLDLGDATSDLYLYLSYYVFYDGEEYGTGLTGKTDDTGKVQIPIDTRGDIDVLTLWSSKSGQINFTVTPRLYKGLDKNVYINLTYNADTKTYIDNELAKIKTELLAAILNS